jgi:UDP-N-acetylmuramyl pentapeptide phosphotransferase/UDP-N-acetylglucosamine-1-phosphate transferase
LQVKREEYNAALAATIFMMFLGFADDVLDLRWRFGMLPSTIQPSDSLQTALIQP